MKNLRYPLYILTIILLNIAATTLFFRLDLTENKSYSLSGVSTDLVKNLEEPLTIKVFLSEKLPVPYNNLERDLRDILLEYKLKANRHFNFTIDIIRKDVDSKIKPETYNIYPVNIQNIEEDEVKVVSAYIGMSFIHGDLVKTLPAIQYNQNLELTITNTIRELTEKTTSLLGLKENIKAQLYLSPKLFGISNELRNYNKTIGQLIDDLNSDFFNKIDFEYIEVNEDDIPNLINSYKLTTLNLEDQSGNITKTVASIVIKKDENSSTINLINNDIFGRTVITGGDELSDKISSNINKIIGAKAKIGYLTSNGTIPLNQNQMMQLGNQQEPGINSLNKIIQENYSMATVDLKNDNINDDIKTLIIARPTQRFTDRELFLLDQFLLSGNSVLLAIDQVTMDMENSNPNYGVEVYKELDHGLMDLLSNYGISVDSQIIMDEESFKQVQKDRNGSIVETQVYFAPIIKSENINKKLTLVKGINDLMTFRMTEVKALNSSVQSIFSSSKNSWSVGPNELTLNPSRIQPNSDQSSFSLAVLKDGNFKSFFTNKDIPTPEFKTPNEDNTQELKGVSGKEGIIETSDKGKLIVFGSSDMLTDSILSNNYPSNILLIQNVIDYLSDREDYTQMRNKGIFNRPIKETSVIKKNFIKYFNIIGLPILIIVAGFISYLIWLSKKNRIKAMFLEENNEK